MGMKPVLNEPQGVVRNTVTQPKKTGDEAEVKNTVTRKKHEENKNVLNQSSPAPNSNKKTS